MDLTALGISDGEEDSVASAQPHGWVGDAEEGARSDDDADSAASDVEETNGVDAVAEDASSVGSAASGDGMDVDASAAADDAGSYTSFAAPANDDDRKLGD